MKEEREKIEMVVKCSECGSVHLNRDYSRGELVCGDCGLVLEEGIIDSGPEWRAFNEEQRKERARTGAPRTFMLHDRGLATTIGWQNRDSYGKSIPTRTRGQVYRLRKWQKKMRISSATERNLVIALSELDRLASGMGLPRDVRETAAIIYRKATFKNLVRGRTIEGIVAAAFYAACRQCHVPRTLDEIAKSSRIARREIGRNYRFIAGSLRLKLLPPPPEDYLARFCSGLRLSGNVQIKAREILKEATAIVNKEINSGRRPTGTMAAILYISSVLCREKRTQEQIADITGVTSVTVRNRYIEISKRLGIYDDVQKLI